MLHTRLIEIAKLSFFNIGCGKYMRHSISDSLSSITKLKALFFERRLYHSYLYTVSYKTQQSVNKIVLVPVASGCEEAEITTIVNVLRRAGAIVNIALADSRDYTSMNPLCFTGVQGIKLCADLHIEDVSNEEYDMIVIPGGIPGAEHLANCDMLINMLRRHKESRKWLAAIGSSPKLVLEQNNMFLRKDGSIIEATSQPTSCLRVKSFKNVNVVISDHFVTSQSTGTVLEFSLNLVKILFGKNKFERMKDDLVFKF